MQKKISIIIPCYNVEEYIDRCVNSLLTQTIGLSNLELIFINDASPDKTIDKLLEYEKKYPEDIIVINSSENLKQGGARNLGLMHASCEYIGFVDSDDWIVPTMYEKLYSKAIEYDCDVVTCAFKRVYNEENMGRTGLNDKFCEILNEDQRKSLLIDGLGPGISKLYRKSILINNDIYFPEHLSYEDNYFGNLVLFYANRIYHLEEYLYYYFINPQSTVVKKDSPHHFDRLSVELIKLDTFKKRGLLNMFYDEIEYKFILLFYINTLHITFTRFNTIPGNILSHMQNVVTEHFPNYKNNKYILGLTPVNKILFQTLDIHMSQKDWQEFATVYANNINDTI